ncbi:HAMP domain-containing protein [Motiliproteus coralliicola]|uniref:histidine kinase n=1 Tax=Motiliproteus coralliicola TaxID=2283196 RepID=A0A369WE16_9GAMM|nr:cache domain-containing protein [Motiliproteus coralliicola]RDE19571.1 HAMP domain-containing protein [Motiliproteus coralliicola]
MLNRVYQLISSSLRYRLLALVLFPILLVMPFVVGMAYLWSNEVSYRQLLMKVSTDLSVAHEAFEDQQRDYLQQLTLTAESYPFQQAAQQAFGHRPELAPLTLQLQRLQQRKLFDFVFLIDNSGCDLTGNLGCGLKRLPMMERARIENGSVGVSLFEAADLARIDPALAERVYLPIQSTPWAIPQQRDAEDRGMVFLSYYPIRDAEGDIQAFLSAGVLVNGNFEFVDQLKRLVYGKGSLAEDSLGTVTVFLGDVRINTNVPKKLAAPGQRAIGTLVSKAVHDQVLERGEKWIDRAFVVSEWYISAYEPIIDIYGRRIGMLYAGFLEAPFKETYFQALRWLGGLFLLVTLLSVTLAVRGAKSIFKPIEAMTRVMARVRAGGDERIGGLETRDELSMLAQQMDVMLDKLSQQHQQIQADADQLEVKVEKRTAQLQQRTDDLQRNLDLLKKTRQQLVAKEKLAAIGELTAGIAHEINNPTAVILGNMDLLMAELDEAAAEPVRRESELIVEQVYRIRAIISNLLQYSRPNDYLAQLSPMQVNQVVEDSLVLVRHDLAKKSIRLRLDLRADMTVKGNPQQLQQVLINLIVNAVNAIQVQLKDSPGAGEICIRSRNRGEGVLLLIRDNGCGIDSEILPRIFDPFFTRSQGGTGLGLSVSYGILERVGGEINVRSRPGLGSSFFVYLPQQPQIDQRGEEWIRKIV